MTQADIVLKHMKKTGSITTFEALIDHSIVSLSRRICDLKEMGFKIEKEWKRNKATGKRYVRYRLAKEVA